MSEQDQNSAISVLTSSQVQQYIRIAIYNVSGAIISHGYVSESYEQLLVGALTFLANLAWTIYGNRFMAKLNDLSQFKEIKHINVETSEVAAAAPSNKVTQ